MDGRGIVGRELVRGEGSPVMSPPVDWNILWHPLMPVDGERVGGSRRKIHDSYNRVCKIPSGRLATCGR